MREVVSKVDTTTLSFTNLSFMYKKGHYNIDLLSKVYIVYKQGHYVEFAPTNFMSRWLSFRRCT